jgi:hypothetical protein
MMFMKNIGAASAMCVQDSSKIKIRI